MTFGGRAPWMQKKTIFAKLEQHFCISVVNFEEIRHEGDIISLTCDPADRCVT